MSRLLLLLAWLPSLVIAGDYNERRAHFNYQLFCQGCHTPDGVGARHVPKLKDYIATFLQTEAGRQYLVRVPGAATSALNDEELAEVLNWMISSFGGTSLAPGYIPYRTEEVAELRKKPLNEVERYRQRLLADIAALPQN